MILVSRRKGKKRVTAAAPNQTARSVALILPYLGNLYGGFLPGSNNLQLSVYKGLKLHNWIDQGTYILPTNSYKSQADGAIYMYALLRCPTVTY